MSKWLKSTTNKSYTVLGLTIPKAVVTRGKKEYLQVSDTQWTKISAIKAVQALVKQGYIQVLSSSPGSEANVTIRPEQKLAALRLENTQLKKDNEKKLARSDAALERAQALQELRKKNRELQKQLEEAKANEVVEESNVEVVENTGVSDSSTDGEESAVSETEG